MGASAQVTQSVILQAISSTTVDVPIPAGDPVLGAVPVDGLAMEGVGADPRTEEPAAQVSGESMADAVFAGIPDTADKVYSGLCPQGKTHLDLSCHQLQNCQLAHVLMRLFQSSYKQVYPFSFRICLFVHNGSLQYTKTVRHSPRRLVCAFGSLASGGEVIFQNSLPTFRVLYGHMDGPFLAGNTA